ncbi:MAG: hypothetical protein LH614_14135, partial [Pyrinomonadaceae bacterium]|nr:hypothetical protein [Pyrinomonadaceae bacterium]
MMRKLLLGLISIAALGLMPFSSCVISAQDDETFIQGKWRLVGEFPKDKSGRSRVWFLEWTFADGKFLQTGYPPIKQEGKYRIVKRDEDKLTLELYEQKGTFGTKDRQIEIVIDKKNKRLKIMKQEGFSRVE